MVWNPDLYNQYKDLRNQPFYDLVGMLDLQENINGIDLGCGTGEQTAILKRMLPNSTMIGIDSSKEMLAKSTDYQTTGLRFELQDIQGILAAKKQYDLVFSNAALQWVDNHDLLFPNLMDLLRPGGQLAVQMPVQNENLLNIILSSLVRQEPYATIFEGFTRDSPVLSIDRYAQLLFEHGLGELQIAVKMYPIIANNKADLYNFIAGSALQPYLEQLTEDGKRDFIDDFNRLLEDSFKSYPAIYAFKRILLYGRRP